MLDRPPAERYVRRNVGGDVAPPSADAGPPTVGPASWRPEIAAVVTAIGTALVLALVGGPLSSTAGLVFVAGLGGAIVGLLLAGSPRAPRVRRRLGLGLAVGAVVAGAVATWLFAQGEGGTLGLLDYLWATTGLLVPAEIAVAAIAAAWGVSAGPIRS